MNVGGVDTGLDLDRNRSRCSRTPNDSIGTVSESMARPDIESWNAAQDLKSFGVKLQSGIDAHTLIYRHYK